VNEDSFDEVLVVVFPGNIFNEINDDIDYINVPYIICLDSN